MAVAGCRFSSPGSVGLERHRFQSAGLGARLSIGSVQPGPAAGKQDDARLSIGSDWSFFDGAVAEDTNLFRRRRNGLATRSEPTLRIPRRDSSFADAVWWQKMAAKRATPDPEKTPAEAMLVNTLLKHKEMADRGGGRLQWTPRVQHSRPAPHDPPDTSELDGLTNDLEARTKALERKLDDKVERREQWLALWNNELQDLGWKRPPTEGKRGLLGYDQPAIPAVEWTASGDLVRGRHSSAAALQCRAAAHSTGVDHGGSVGSPAKSEHRAGAASRSSRPGRRVSSSTRPARTVHEISSRLGRCRPLMQSSLRDSRRGQPPALRRKEAGRPDTVAAPELRRSVLQALSAVDQLSAEQARERARTACVPLVNPWWLPGGGRARPSAHPSYSSPAEQARPGADARPGPEAEAKALAIQIEMHAIEHVFHEDRPASRAELAAALGMVSAARGAITGEPVDVSAVRGVLEEALKEDVEVAADEATAAASTPAEMPSLEMPALEVAEGTAAPAEWSSGDDPALPLPLV